MNWCGDFPEDFTAVTIFFTTHDTNGAPVAPLTAFEADDVKIYKNGNAAQKTTTNGVTMTSPFDGIVGLHCVTIDTSNNTGDVGFWTTGGGQVYTVVLNPDTETVNGQTALKVIGTFGVDLSSAVKPTTPGNKINVDNTGAVTALTAAAIQSIWDALTANLTTSSTIGKLLVDNVNATVSSRATQTSVDTVSGKTANLPSDPADASDIAAAFSALQTHGDSTWSTIAATAVRSAVGLATANLDTQLATIAGYIDTEVASILAAVDTEVASIKLKTDLIPGTQDGKTFAQIILLMASALLGKASGLDTTTAVFRALDDSKDRITATVDTDGNRTAVTLDAS